MTLLLLHYLDDKLVRRVVLMDYCNVFYQVFYGLSLRPWGETQQYSFSHYLAWCSPLHSHILTGYGPTSRVGVGSLSRIPYTGHRELREVLDRSGTCYGDGSSVIIRTDLVLWGGTAHGGQAWADQPGEKNSSGGDSRGQDKTGGFRGNKDLGTWWYSHGDRQAIGR